MAKNKKQETNSPKMNEKSLQVLSCALAVVILIILMSGDMIITRFIKVKPNQDYPASKLPQDKPTDLEQNEQDSVYVSIDLSTLLSKIEAKEEVIVLSGRDGCGACQRFKPVLESVLKEQNRKAYYLDRNENMKTDEYQKLIALDPFIELSFSSTPFLMLFQNGSYKNGICGMMEEENALKITLGKMITETYQK